MDAEWTADSDAPVSRESHAESEFAELAGESSALAFRVAWSVLRVRADAEEIAQEALSSASPTHCLCAWARAKFRP